MNISYFVNIIGVASKSRAYALNQIINSLALGFLFTNTAISRQYINNAGVLFTFNWNSIFCFSLLRQESVNIILCKYHRRSQQSESICFEPNNKFSCPWVSFH